MEPWAEIVRRYEQFAQHTGISETVAQQELRRWHDDLIAVAGGHICIENVEHERYLSLDEKARLVFAAISEFAPTAVFGGQARAESCPFTALAYGCMQFPDKGPTITALCGELARFTAFTVAERMISREGLDGAWISPSRKSARKLLSDPLNFRSEKLLRALVGRVRGGMDVNMFATTAAWVDAHGTSGDALAEAVRDGLGLPHLDGEEMVEIRFTEDVVRRSGTFKKPTVADALGWPPFLPSETTDTFGYARHLTSPAQRGGPEIWHGPLLAREASGMRMLGRPRVRLPAGIWSAYGDWK